MNLVFASGFFVPQHILGIDYFRGLKAHVEGNGHQALFPEVPPLGTCEVLADLLAGAKPEGLRRLLYEGVSHAIGLLGIPTGALANLTEEAASRVPDAAKTHPHIRYRSYFASGRPGPLPTCFALGPTHHYIHAVTGQVNDGVVALRSAKYGEFQEPFWRCDHSDTIGHNLDTADLGGFRFDHF